MFIDTDSPYPFRSKRSVSSMLKQFRSKREREVSIVHECCMKACTQDELYGYCGWIILCNVEFTYSFSNATKKVIFYSSICVN